jgi:integrase
MANQSTPPHLWKHPQTRRFYLVWQEPGGITKRQSLRTEDRLEAEAKLEEVQRDLGEGYDMGNRALTLGEAARQWLRDREEPERGLSRKTLYGYQRFVDQLLAVASADQLVADMRARDCRLILRAMRDAFSLSPGSMRGRHVAFGMMFRWLVRDEVLTRNPVDSLEAPKVEKQRKPALTVEEFQALAMDLENAVEAATDERVERGYQAVRDQVEVLWLSGMRSIESIRLEWEDVNLEAMTWTIRSPRNKGGEKALPIHRGLREVLLRRRLLGGPGPFQPESYMRTWWRRWKERNPRWKGTSLHSLRHSFVTRLRRAGEKEAAMQLARHASDAMSDHYNHVAPEEFRAALDRL